MPVVRETVLSLLLALAFAGAAVAAPNTTPDPVAECASKAAVQYGIDDAQCYAIPLEQAGQRQLCQSQALLKYSLATAACSGRSSGVRTSVSPTFKQNIDSGFTRRLR